MTAELIPSAKLRVCQGVAELQHAVNLFFNGSIRDTGKQLMFHREAILQSYLRADEVIGNALE